MSLRKARRGEGRRYITLPHAGFHYIGGHALGLVSLLRSDQGAVGVEA
jgi:hypothetical protein